MKRTKTLTSAALVALLFLVLPLSAFGKKVKYVSLQLQKVDTVSRFAAIKIIDFRPSKDPIGVGSLGFSGLSPICFEHPDEFNTYLSKRIVFNNLTTNDTLVLAVYAYHFEIGTGMNAFRFDADCYVGSNGKYRSAGYMRFCREVKDRSKAEEYISAVTDSVVVKRLLTANAIDRQVIDEQFILNGRSAEIAKIPVYNEPVKDGLYRTAKDFFNNTPSETGMIKWVSSDMMTFNLVASDGSKTKMKAKDFFAVCSNGHLYKVSGKGLVKVKFVNNNFYFPVLLTGVSELTAYDKHGGPTAPFAVAVATSLANPDKETKAYNCKIDFRTGEYYPVLESELPGVMALRQQ